MVGKFLVGMLMIRFTAGYWESCNTLEAKRQGNPVTFERSSNEPRMRFKFEDFHYEFNVAPALHQFFAKRSGPHTQLDLSGIEFPPLSTERSEPDGVDANSELDISFEWIPQYDLGEVRSYNQRLDCGKADSEEHVRVVSEHKRALSKKFPIVLKAKEGENPTDDERAQLVQLCHGFQDAVHQVKRKLMNVVGLDPDAVSEQPINQHNSDGADTNGGGSGGNNGQVRELEVV